MHGHTELSPNKKRLIIVAAIILAIIIFEAVFFIFAPLIWPWVLSGVSANGIPLSGMTESKAFEAMSAAADEIIGNISVTLVYGDKTWTFSAADMGATFDVKSLADNAAAIGHTGSLRQRMSERQAAKSGLINFSLWDYFKAPQLADCIKIAQKEIYVPCTEPSLVMACEGFKFTLGEDGYYKDGIDYSSMFEYSPGAAGLDIDIEAAEDKVIKALSANSNAVVTLDAQAVSPGQTEETLREDAVHLYHSVSKLRGSTDDRNNNIMLALNNFDGMVIEPGETVSFNNIVGEPTKEKGYRASGGALIGQDTAQQYGQYGQLGLGQASTTLYNAVLMAGCEIIERHPHQFPVYYLDYDYGLDANVEWGSYDLVFKNTTGSRLYIDCYFCYSNDKPTYIDIDIYGAPPADGSQISIKSTVLETLQPQPILYVDKPDYATGLWEYDDYLGLMVSEFTKGREGMVVQVTREWTKDGEVIKTEDIGTTRYEPVQGVIYTKPRT